MTKEIIVKLTTLVLGFLFLVYLLHGLQGGSRNGNMLMGRKLKSLTVEPKTVANRSLRDSESRNLEREVDQLMRHEYPSPVKPRKRTPIHNGEPINGH